MSWIWVVVAVAVVAAAAAQIQLLAWEHPYAKEAAVKQNNKKTQCYVLEKKKKKRQLDGYMSECSNCH